MKKTVTLLFFMSLCAHLALGQSGLEITLAHNSENEIQTKSKLEALLKEYDVSKWIFTKKIIIDEQETGGHSHPILTLSLSKRTPIHFLALFVHEQIHWFEEMHSKQRDKAIDDLKEAYPDAPDGPPEGARNKESTYLHLIVCFLEYEAMKELVGKEQAKALIERKSLFTYKWIYRTVLSDGDKIKAVLDKHNLKI